MNVSEQPLLQVEDLFEATGYSMAAVGLMHSQGRVMLALDAHDRLWRLPGGPVRRMEAPVDAVRRSIRAMTGVCVSVGGFLGVVHDPRTCRLEIIFEVRAIEGCELSMDRTQILHAVWFRTGAPPANISETARSAIEAFAGQHVRPFFVTHRGGDGGVWQT